MTVHNIIDGNSLGYTKHNGPKLNTGDMQTQAIFGFIQAVRKIKMGSPGSPIMVLWDGKAQWRFDLWPQYKSNRDNEPEKVAMREAYAAQKPFIYRALKAMGVRQVTAFTHEADDMAGFFVKRFTAAGQHSVLHTGDQDWLQLVNEYCSAQDVRDESKWVHCNQQNFTDKTGFLSPIAFLEGKALQGDTSDVIPGVGGISDKGAPLFLAEHGSVFTFLKCVADGSYTPKQRADKNAKTLHPEQALASAEGRAKFLRNMKLMQLQNVIPPRKADLQIIEAPADQQEFQELCEELAFFSITKHMNVFFQPFK